MNDKYVAGWDDPRLLTISGLRRRGYTAEGINLFCDRVRRSSVLLVFYPSSRCRCVWLTVSCLLLALRCLQIGVSRNTNSIPDTVLETAGRDNLEPLALRAMVVVKPVRVVITNFAEGKVGDSIEVPNHPKDESKGTRRIAISRVVYIDRDDFRTGNPDASFYGLAVGREVLLKYAFVIRCDSVKTDAAGEVSLLLCSVLGARLELTRRVLLVHAPCAAG